MAGYGDKDPAEVYDAGDPIPVRLLLIVRILEAIDNAVEETERRRRRRRDVVRLLRNIADELANNNG